MKVLVLGASGATGSLVAKQLLNEGVAVKAMVSRPVEQVAGSNAGHLQQGTKRRQCLTALQFE